MNTYHKVTVNGVWFDCNANITGGRDAEAIFDLNSNYETVKESFVDNATLVVDFGQDELTLTDFKLVSYIRDNCNGTVTVAYKKLSDLEKLIELHYGGVN